MQTVATGDNMYVVDDQNRLSDCCDDAGIQMPLLQRSCSALLELHQPGTTPGHQVEVCHVMAVTLRVIQLRRCAMWVHIFHYF